MRFGALDKTTRSTGGRLSAAFRPLRQRAPRRTRLERGRAGDNGLSGAQNKEERVRYVVIETFTQGPRPVYGRAAERGRMLPAGLVYLDSWIDERRLDRCFQLMDTDDPSLFDEWIAKWSDLVDFEIVPVISAAEAAARINA